MPEGRLNVMAIDIALCFRDDSGTYHINAYVTLVSIFENTGEDLAVHILHDSTVEHGRKHLEELCAAYGHELRFHHVPELAPDVVEKISSRFNIGATYRYYIHEFVTADKAVYLDCDVIVNREIKDLYDQPIGESLLASTLDCGNYWIKGRPNKLYRKTIDYLGIAPESYISSGLLLMNLKRLREISGESNIFVQKTLEAVGNNILLRYPDMDIINSVAAAVPNGVRVLEDHRFNLWHGALHMGLAELENTIFHFVSKPLEEFFPAHLLYWKYYAKTPFAGDMFERMSEAYCSRRMEFVKNYVLRPRERRHARELLQYGMGGMLLRALCRKLGITIR